MTRPIRSTQLDGLAAILTKLGHTLTHNGPGRTALAVLRDHAHAHGYPTKASGTDTGGTSGGSSTSSTERAALTPPDPSARRYHEAINLLRQLQRAAPHLAAILAEADPTRTVQVCPRCSVPIPAARVRCPKCNQHPDTRICGNLSCMQPVPAGAKLLQGSDGVHRCETCHRFRKRNGRDRTADDTIAPDDEGAVRASDGTVAFRWRDATPTP